MEFFIIQLIGFIAWLFLVISYWRKKVNEVLLFQVISCALFALQYYLLGAMSGLYIVLFEMVRDFSYYKSDNDRKLFYYSIPLYISIAVLNFNGIISVLPSIASMIDGFSLTGKKNLIIVGGILSYLIWFIYDLAYGSYAGTLSSLILCCSNTFVLLKSFKNCKQKNK